MTFTPRALLGDEKPDPTPSADQREQALAALARIESGDYEPATFQRIDLFKEVRAALTPPPLPADLAEIQARADAATSGPWYQGRDKISGESASEAWTRKDCTDPESCDLLPVAAREEDAHFIAHARTDVPALVTELAAWRARPTLTAEQAAQALTWEGIVSANTTIPPHGHEAATVATLRAIAEGAKS